MIRSKRINHNEEDVQGRFQPSIPATVKTATDRGTTLAGPQAPRKKPNCVPIGGEELEVAAVGIAEDTGEFRQAVDVLLPYVSPFTQYSRGSLARAV
jgi:hypothetical protein